MSLQRVDMGLNPIPDTKKRMIRLKFQNKSMEELIMVREEEYSPGVKGEGDDESVCTLQVCENDESHAMVEM